MQVLARQSAEAHDWLRALGRLAQSRPAVFRRPGAGSMEPLWFCGLPPQRVGGGGGDKKVRQLVFKPNKQTNKQTKTNMLNVYLFQKAPNSSFGAKQQLQSFKHGGANPLLHVWSPLNWQFNHQFLEQPHFGVSYFEGPCCCFSGFQGKQTGQPQCWGNTPLTALAKGGGRAFGVEKHLSC